MTKKMVRLIEIGTFRGGVGARFSLAKSPDDTQKRTFILPLTRAELRALPFDLGEEVTLTLSKKEQEPTS